MSTSRAWFAIVLLMACGGTAAAPPPVTGPVGPTATTGGATTDPATPFDPEVVRASLAAAPGTEACSAEAGETFAALMTRQGALLGGPGQIDERFRCQPPSAEDGEGAPWMCTWTVAAKPPATVDPDDPCGGECCSSFSVQVEVAADGAANLAGAACLAAG